ncbi:MAG: translation initiation factor IF-2 [Inquilinaceae bacterium]
MTDSNEQDRKSTLKLGGGKLELRKTIESGQVRQSFSHGRSKTVTVEVKRKRTIDRGGPAAGDGAGAEAATEGGLAGAVARGRPQRRLTEAEREARETALRSALREEDQRQQAETARQAVETPAEAPPAPASPAEPLTPQALRDREMAELREIEENERRRTEEERARIEEIEQQRLAEQAKLRAAEQADEEKRRKVADRVGRAGAAKVDALEGDDDASKGRSRRAGDASPASPRRPAVRNRVEPRRRGGKLTISQALSGDDGARMRSLAAVRRAREKERRGEEQPPEKIVREVVVPETITIQELANRMAERGVDVIKSLMKMGVMATITQTIDADTAELLVNEFGHRIKRVSEADVEVGLRGEEDDTGDLMPRPPVVTVMGHVDHGKTSLLDALRQSDVAAREAGGITQHIGAYQVTMENGARITFIDTPGHEAFTEMRARGANTTDIVILVVAADDGIMPQTVEAIRHATAAEVPIIVAINKIDLPDADTTRVNNELLQHNIVVEAMGGDVLTVEVSAKTKQGLDKLEEAILLQAELLELRGNPNRSAEGSVIEAKLERGRGPVATVLVQRGTLKVGDIFVTGSEWGRVRAMINDRGEQIDAAGPSMPVEVLGLNGAPLAGDDFIVVETEARAREITEFRGRKKRDLFQAAGARGTLEQMFTQIAAGAVKELPMVIKGDVQGSIEAIASSVEKLVGEETEVRVRILHSAVGGINESDITLAKSTGAMVIGFNVRANPQAREMARRDGVDIRYYSVIYNVIDDVRQALSGMLSPTLRENFLGNAEIREIFNITKVGKVAGCHVTEGMVRRGAKVRLLRDNIVIHEGTLKTLKRFKEEVREVREGYECGMAFENYEDIRVGDVIEAFETEEVARQL